MIANESSQASKDRIFKVLHEIDLKVDKIKRKGIVFVGMSRVGKSTAYNWTIRHPLEAKAEEIVRQTVEKKVEVIASTTGRKRRGVENQSLVQSQKPQTSTTITYVPRIIQSETGQVRSGIKSCTLVPNIFDLDPQTTLLDMAGYGDSRDYIGTLGVSYSLRAVFEVLQEVKFIIVVTEPILKNTKQLCDTLNHFFGMFDLSRYPDIEERIFDATSLLITQSVDYINYYDIIYQAKFYLEDKDIKNIDNRELIADFLYYIGSEVNRFREFKMARLGQPPEQCKIIEEFNKKGWKYFNLKATREQVMKNFQDPDIIKLPFQKEFRKMKSYDQQNLSDSIDKRLKSYEVFSKIFEDLFKKIFDEGSTNDIKLPYRKFFSDISKFVAENDHYESEKYIPFHSMECQLFLKPEKETLFYLLLKIKKVVNLEDVMLESSKQQIKPIMDIFRNRFTQLVQLISVIFCRNIYDYRLMLQLRFILLRGIRQFYMLLHVSHEKVSICVNVIHDNFQFIFPTDYKDYWCNFFRSFRLNPDERIQLQQKNQQNYMERYIKTRENAFAMEILCKTHQETIMTFEYQILDKYYQILRYVKLIHARHQFQQYEYRKCLVYLYEAIILQTKFQENLMKHIFDYCKGSLQKKCYLYQVDIIKKNMYMNQDNIFKMLKQTYIKLKHFQIALQISINLNWVHSTCEIFDILIQEKGKINKEILQEYAFFCMDHGLPEKGRALFHRLLEAQKTFDRKKEILNNIQSYIQNPHKQNQAYLIFIHNQYFVDLKHQRRKKLLKIIGQSIKEENYNIDKIIDMVKHQQYNNQGHIQQQILFNYLQNRDSSQMFCAAYGFTVNYNVQMSNIPTFIINNSSELNKLNIWLIQHIETVSQLSKNIPKAQRLRIDVKQIDSLSISKKSIVITLDPKQLKRTFQCAVKIMKAIKKLIYEQHEKLLMVIKLAHETIQKTDIEIRDHLLEEYRDSITKEEIQAIKSIIQKMPKAINQAVEAEYRKLYKEPRLVRSELTSIFDYIRLKNCQEIYRKVKQKMMEVSNAKDPSSEIDCTRDYY